MPRGRRPDPGREKRGTGHRPKQGTPRKSKELVISDEPRLAPPPHLVAATKLPDLPPDDNGVVRPDPEAVGARDAIELWDLIVDRLGGVVDPADSFILESAVGQFARMREAATWVAKVGMFVEGPGGGMMVAPWVKAERDAAMAFLRLAEHLGLTRLARTRLGVLNAAGQTLVQALMKDLDATA